MSKYPIIRFGKYHGTPINEIPMDYLVWLFPGLSHKKKHRQLYVGVLEYFLERDVRVENHTSKGQGFHFYFNDYHNAAPVSGEKPFMQSFWRLKNSKGEFVYEVGPTDRPIFLDVTEDGFEISSKYVAHKYRFGGLLMVYENNPNYYFYDGFGRVMRGAYLMRRPWIPDGEFLSGDFSENLPIEKLDKQNKNHYKTF